jgi:hypothetical protein
LFFRIEKNHPGIRRLRLSFSSPGYLPLPSILFSYNISIMVFT